MKIKHILLAAGLAVVSLSITAKTRTTAQIAQAAAEALAANGTTKPGNHRQTLAIKSLKQISRTTTYTIMGTTNAYAIVANDDAFPAIIGYADKAWDTSTDNANFQWWLQAISSAMQQRLNAGQSYTPSVRHAQYANRVMPLVSALWGQEKPYYNECPSDGGRHCLTGCVATAMAEIMYCYKYPVHGRGTHSIYYPYGSSSGVKVTADFGNATYDWANMLPQYTAGYDSLQGAAVASLMKDCGVAVDMQYSTQSSGALPNAAADAFKRYFGYPTSVTYADRSTYADSVWMDIIYRELNERRPILYTGNDLTAQMGHAFVVDGYDEKGLVHVNWGWEGQNNGYYNIDILNPASYRFQYGQTMTYGIQGRETNLESSELTLTTAGTLASLIGEDNIYKIGRLTLHGTINGTDLKTIAQMAGRDSRGIETRGSLSFLDLSDCKIVAGGGTFLFYQGKDYVTADNEVPAMAFYNCQSLDSIILPRSVEAIGEGFIGMCTSLNYVELPVQGKQFRVSDGLVLTVNGDSLIAALPNKSDVTVPEGVKHIDAYAFAGNVGLKNVTFPKTTTSIGGSAFSYCYQLSGIRVNALTVPELTGNNVFNEVPFTTCIVYVPVGSGNDYKSDAQWSQFIGISGQTRFNNIQEFGLLIKARNNSKVYGDALPRLAYTIQGETMRGRPVISCEANELSPVGDYEIKMEQGTLRNSYIRLENGTLHVTPATLTLTADTITVMQGSPMPVFTYKAEGFRNYEDTTVFSTQPVLSCGAKDTKVAGDYTITISGAEANNYTLVYIPGVLHVVTATGINVIRLNDTDNSSRYYDLQGRVIEGQPQPGQIVIRKGHKFIAKP